jgi:uncharacterized GH25 family protein
MPVLTVNVTDSDGEPVENIEVQIFITHTFAPNTWLKEDTDEDGNVEFEVEKHYIVSVYVDGNLEKEDISIGESAEYLEVTI